MLDSIVSFFKSTTEYIKQLIIQAREDSIKLQEYRIQQDFLMEKQFLDNCILEMMDRMQIDLYEALASHDYSLAPIHVADSIRIRDYKYDKGKYYYIFTLDKKIDEKIPACKLQNICSNMNADISSAYRRLYYSLYSDTLVYNHPFLSAGIRICDIKDFGHPHVYLIVETHITPEVFFHNYHHFPSSYLGL